MSNTELIARLRSFETDHKPEGWPAIQMRDVSALLDAIEALEAQLAAAPSVPEGWKQAVALAYGHLWHVNNEPMAPTPLRSSETAAYEARKQLRDLLTHEERGLAINQVQAILEAAPQPKEPK